MAAIITNAFGGERPIVQPRLLNDSEAQTAQNVRLVSGRIEPMKGPTTLKALSNALATTIFRFGNSDTEGNWWLEWTNHVHAVRSPIANDQYDRLYWTGEGADSTLYPRYAPSSLVISGGGAYPGGSYRLGLPRPAGTITASGTAVVNPTVVTREYVITYVDGTSPTKESIPSREYSVSAVNGGEVIFSNLPDSNEGDSRVTHKRIYRKLSGTYRLVTTQTLATQTYTDTMTDATLASQSALNTDLAATIVSTKGPTTAPRATAASGAGTIETTENRVYLVTMINGSYTDSDGNIVTFPESYASAQFRITTDGTTETTAYKNQSVTLTGFNILAAGPPVTFSSYNVPAGVTFQSWRVYRRRTNETTFKRIAEVPVNNSTTFSIIDYGTIDGDIVWSGVSVNYPDTTKQPGTLGAFRATKDAAYVASTTTQNRVYCVTFSNASGGESPPSLASNVVTVTDGATVTLSHTEAIPTGIINKRIYRKQQTEANSFYRRIGEFPVSQTSFTDTATAASISGAAQVPLAFRDLLATPTEVATVTGKIPATKVPETRTYVYTYVTAYGEEGPPSTASTAIDIDPAQAVNLSGMSAAPSGAYNVTHKRIYRSSTVGNQAQFQFVAEIAVALATYSDTKTQSDLGETLPSETWEAPPAKLFNLRMMANGIACGFVKDGTDRTVVLSEAFLPHAWPPEYSFTTDDAIVGIGVFRQSIAVLTKSYPYVIYGVDPAAMSMTRLELQQACVSAKSIVETGDGVMYASPDGLISISGNGAQNITQSIFTREQWQAYIPSSMQCFFHDGRIHILYGTTQQTRGMLILDISGQGALLTRSDINVTTEIKGGYYDARTDTLYWIQGGNIVRHNRGSELAYTWKSKEFKAPKPLNFNCAQVLAETYPINLKVYADGVLKLDKNVQNANIFTLPSGFLAQDWEYQVTNSTTANNVTTINPGKVYSVSIAQSYAEIKAT